MERTSIFHMVLPMGKMAQESTAGGANPPKGANIHIRVMNNHITLSSKMRENPKNELPEGTENWTTGYIMKLNRAIGYQINCSDIFTKKIN